MHSRWIEFSAGVNAYLFGSFVLLGLWAATGIVTYRRRVRADVREFWWGSAWCALLGFTEPLFVPAYWYPPSILRIGRWDAESFLFCFCVGGIAAVLPEIPGARRAFHRLEHAAWSAGTRSRMAAARLLTAAGSDGCEMLPSSTLRWSKEERRQDNILFLTFLLGVFGVTAHLRWNIIYDTSLTCLAVAGFIGWRAPWLRWQVVAGGFSFLGLYTVVLWVVGVFYPEFYVRYWNLRELSGFWLFGVPIEEYMFAFTLGMLWAPLYESWRAEGSPAVRTPW